MQFAVVVSLLLLLFFGIFGFARELWTQSVLNYAVEEAARCASINSAICTSNSATATYASQQTMPLNLSSLVFTASSASRGNLVKASYGVTFMVPKLLPFNITLAS